MYSRQHNFTPPPEPKPSREEILAWLTVSKPPEEARLLDICSRELEILMLRKEIGWSKVIEYDLAYFENQHARLENLLLIVLILDSREHLNRLIDYYTEMEFDHVSAQRSAGVSKNDLCPVSRQHSMKYFRETVHKMLESASSGYSDLLRKRLEQLFQTPE